MEIWCNEAQERYVLALEPGSVARFKALCERERCPAAVVGEITADGRLLVSDPKLELVPVDMPIEVLLGKPPRMTRDVRSIRKASTALSTADTSVAESLDRLLCLPTIASSPSAIAAWAD
jgi:phosphoribosylformylglycinamidine synthase